MTINTTVIHALSFKTERDLFLVNILSALLIAIIAFFPNLPARTILGLPFILFFSGYVLICALFPRKEDLDIIERLALSFGLSIAATSLIGLTLNYMPFGIRLYSVTFSLFSFILSMSVVAMYRRRGISPEDVFAPLASISISKWRNFEWVKSEFMKFSNGNIIIKIIAIIALIFITLSTILIKNTENTGYEVSIYTAIPLLSWIFLIIGIVCGICIVVYNVYTKEHEKNNKWVLGLFLILLSDLIILSSPILLGYAFWGRGDPYTHINTVLNIISSGHIASYTFYPIAHIYVTEFYHISGISPEILFKYIPLLFGIFFVVCMYLFAKSILPNKGQVILATIASTTFIHGWYISLTPNHLSNLMWPLVLFIFFRSYERASHLNTEFRLLLIIMIFLYGAFHPVPAIALLLLFIAVERFNIISSAKDSDNSTHKFGITLSLILAVWTITWLSSFYVWESTIRNIHTLMTECGPTAISDLTDKIAYASGYGYSPLEMFLKQYTGILIYIILALIALPIIIREIRINKSFKNVGSLYVSLSAYLLITIVFFQFSLGFGPLRLMFYSIVICTVLVGFMLYLLLEKTEHTSRKSISKSALCIAFVIFILFFSSIHGILKLYPSPYLLNYNAQVTYSEIEGINWFLDNGIVSTPVALISLKESMKRRRGLIEEMPPYHFNYNNYSSLLGESYTKDIYMVLNKLDRLLYKEVWPEMAELRWYTRDFERLEDDASVDKLYSNGGFDTWYIHAIK